MAGKRPRDSYKARVLEAQANSNPQSTIATQPKQLIDRIIGWKWWENQPRWLWTSQSNYNLYNIRYAYAPGCHFNQTEYWCFHRSSRTTIYLPYPNNLYDLDIVHALAHHLHPDDIQLHGPEFCKAFLNLTLKALGQELHDELYRNLQLQKAKLHLDNPNRPRPVNPIQTTEQLKKLLADLERDMKGTT